MMGRGGEFYCKTCRKYYNLGYGSYRSWLDDCRSVAEFDTRAAAQPDIATLRKNINMRQCLVEHDGHDIETHSEDWAHISKGNLYTETGVYGADELAIEGVGDWEYVNLWPDEPPLPPRTLGTTGNAAVDAKLAAWEARKKQSHG
jgi:hypothetical protein